MQELKTKLFTPPLHAEPEFHTITSSRFLLSATEGVKNDSK